ncbi:FAD-dependent oxidoreductase [Amycolatopsis eburnea]|uniref:FAD-binding monooxygenase n=1 Tax=Amycolatopsis eburnea TaxID=2267691 RepID=A0A3R9FM69_9PSEU|nr:FAD-binding monooxygenase [Amycolatopsis eburnea]RSD16833.1 FAD-binding monooxygenase [Amycolatopsis eburnea]
MSNGSAERAVVLGGSIAGLFTARVLAEVYGEVVVVDRDRFTGPGVRQSVPQGRHAHGLLARGQQAAEELFPGLTGELREAGVAVGDVSARMRWYVDGHRLRPGPTGLLIIGAARPVLEHHVRARVAALPNVRFLTGHDIAGLAATADGSRVTGVHVQERTGGSTPRRLDAALVVDATGRGSRAPKWLSALGYPDVPVERVKVDLAYTSRRYRLRTNPFTDEQSINVIATPGHPRGAFFHTLGGDECLLSLTGLLGDHPPTDPEGFLAYAKSLPVPDVHDAIADAEPLTEPVCFRFPASTRRHYELLPRVPDGFLVVGDAFCVFNPVYGQGMTAAALQARTLRQHLGGTLRPARFFADAARVIDAPWEIAAGGDLAFPGVTGRRSVKTHLGNAYVARVQSAATRDAEVTNAFMRVAGLIDPPQALMRPRLALRVLRGARRAARDDDQLAA